MPIDHHERGKIASHAGMDPLWGKQAITVQQHKERLRWLKACIQLLQQHCCCDIGARFSSFGIVSWLKRTISKNWGDGQRIFESQFESKFYLKIKHFMSRYSQFFFLIWALTSLDFVKFASNFCPKVHLNRLQEHKVIESRLWPWILRINSQIDPLWYKILWSPNGQNMP